jgi:hypothetical protein
MNGTGFSARELVQSAEPAIAEAEVRGVFGTNFQYKHDTGDKESCIDVACGRWRSPERIRTEIQLSTL